MCSQLPAGALWISTNLVAMLACIALVAWVGYGSSWQAISFSHSMLGAMDGFAAESTYGAGNAFVGFFRTLSGAVAGSLTLYAAFALGAANAVHYKGAAGLGFYVLIGL